jgi:hypothetical protein
VEEDEEWGMGPHGNGKNAMGMIQMTVRKHLKNQKLGLQGPTYATAAAKPRPVPTSRPVPASRPVTASRPVPAPRPSKTGCSSKAGPQLPATKPRQHANILLIGNSNIRNIAQKINDITKMNEEKGKMGGSATSYIYRGMGSSYIADQVGHCRSNTETSHVCIHSGDIDIRNMNLDSAKSSLQRLVNTTYQNFQNSRIMINTLSTDVKDPALRHKIRELNDYIVDSCKSDPQFTHIDCSDITLRDNIHFKTSRVSEVAKRIWSTVNWQV